MTAKFMYKCDECGIATHVPLSGPDRQDPPKRVKFKCFVCGEYTERTFVETRKVHV